ncbi:topoisomerase acting in meiosis [Mycena crocata]|nr:topoisomerase acting in meiosis [Mycena crocata]
MRYPAKRAKGSALPFAQLFKVLDLMHAAVIDNVPATKRDIYYKDVPLFGKQRVVDNLVDDLAATLELERSDLNVRATSKGLVCGSGLTIHLVSGEEVHANDTEGALIPVGEDIAGFTMGEDVEWVLIVEKDAVFQTLCRLRLTDHEALSGRGIMITGKGYPDVATRQLVTSLAEGLPKRIPILGLVDGDPYGLDILATYKYGSRGMKHEGGLAAGRVKYVGVFASELGSYGVDRDALLPITKHDEKKALAMLSRPLPAKWRKELSHMLHSRRKAEIEILEGGGLLRYLVAKISKYAGE